MIKLRQEIETKYLCGRDLNLDIYIELIKEDSFQGITNHTKNNSTYGEKETYFL